jgi:hypothetical protein
MNQCNQLNKYLYLNVTSIVNGHYLACIVIIKGGKVMKNVNKIRSSRPILLQKQLKNILMNNTENLVEK